MRKLFVILLFCTFAYARNWPPAGGNDPFSTVESPISEGSAWINGGAVGLDWKNVNVVSGGKAQASALNTGFDDSIAELSGLWGPNQTVCATASITNNSGYQGEMAFRLR